LKFSARPLDSGEYGAAGKLDALLAEAAIQITTSKLCRVVSMHGLYEAVALALEPGDEITPRTASIGLLLQ
jgi:hypothetical protein